MQVISPDENPPPAFEFACTGLLADEVLVLCAWGSYCTATLTYPLDQVFGTMK